MYNITIQNPGGAGDKTAHVTVDGRPELALRPLPSEEAREISERVAQYLDVRGMLAWYLADEPALARFLPSSLEPGFCNRPIN